MHRSDAEDPGQRGDVVGAVLEPEQLRDAEPAAVAAVIEGEHPEVLGEPLEGREPVEVGRRRPAVEQDEHGGAGRAGDLADERPAATW